MNPSDPDPFARVRTAVALPIALAGGRSTPGTLFSFSGLGDAREHFALRLGETADAAALVRLHSECVTGDVLGSRRCDCGEQLQEALERLAREGGYLLYLRQEGRGIGLYRKLEAYRLQEQGHDTFAANRLLGCAADERRYEVAARMLQALGVTRVRLLSNNPDKARALEAAGIAVAGRERTGVFVNDFNRPYLEAKARLGGHEIALQAGRESRP